MEKEKDITRVRIFLECFLICLITLSGFFISDIYLFKRCSQEQYKQYEAVATYAYAKCKDYNDFNYSDENYSISKQGNIIYVSSSKNEYLGRVVAEFTDKTICTTKDYQLTDRIIGNAVFCGIFFIFSIFLVLSLRLKPKLDSLESDF